MNTDRDYADMVNPYVRAEEEAHKRGFREGFLAGLWWTMLAFIIGLALYSAKVYPAEVVRYRFTDAPIRASDVDAQATICQQYREIYGRWLCYAIR